MKIAVVCANGKAGKLIVKEAVDRGHDVTAVVRGENQTVAQHTLAKDLFDLTSEDLAGFDAVVDAFGAWTPETLSEHSTSLAHLCDILSGTEIRLLVVGGAGSLYVNPEHTAVVADGPEFPEAFKPLAAAMAAALVELRRRDDVRWTYISPAGEFQADGERTGAYILAGEELRLNDAGESVISYADYAIAMVDEVERTSDAHIRQRISVVRR
ncbi:NAD(P)-dependent oxidoreductase [Candidatus Collinsella stercoripullorum]|uniref:NAD(P)-dependent oxidoreductase n=1 Tax=Candidatus Collinsella stercoripullorum TaxID=2838522 RepID=UPI0022E469A9|nr:NAD(P)H-binding protein [Candidatus Collinsella stercoripullorum]